MNYSMTSTAGRAGRRRMMIDHDDNVRVVAAARELGDPGSEGAVGAPVVVRAGRRVLDRSPLRHDLPNGPPLRRAGGPMIKKTAFYVRIGNGAKEIPEGPEKQKLIANRWGLSSGGVEAP